MRLDRVVTLLASRTIGSLASRHAITRLPVLMYHSISAAPEEATPYYRTSTHPAVFAEQMQMLQSDGYRGVTLSEGLKAIQHPDARSNACQPVALTFDDGYRDFLTAAVPVLERHGFRATIYLPTAFIGDERRRFNHRECLTWGELSDLRIAGFEFGSHTVSHPRLTSLSWDEVRMELVLSKQTIEQKLKFDVTTFSYPYAFPQQKTGFTKRFMRLLRASAYRSAVTTIIGHVDAQDEALCLKRLPVNSCDDPELLRAKLRGFYNWMAGPQAAAKQFRRW